MPALIWRTGVGKVPPLRLSPGCYDCPSFTRSPANEVPKRYQTRLLKDPSARQVSDVATRCGNAASGPTSCLQLLNQISSKALPRYGSAIFM